MAVKTVGLITWHHPHLKTEQVVHRLIAARRDVALRMYALPYKPRKRIAGFEHRPAQGEAVLPQAMAEKLGIPYVVCSGDGDVDERCDVYLMLGEGGLSAQCVEGKRVIACHPGVIPASRGDDAFKWSIHEMRPLGVTLHYVDAEFGDGEIIAVVPTPVYQSDSLETLARRHYENEIDVLARFAEYLAAPSNPFADVAAGEPKRRMPPRQERSLARRFGEYRALFGGR